MISKRLFSIKHFDVRSRNPQIMLCNYLSHSTFPFQFFYNRIVLRRFRQPDNVVFTSICFSRFINIMLSLISQKFKMIGRKGQLMLFLQFFQIFLGCSHIHFLPIINIISPLYHFSLNSVNEEILSIYTKLDLYECQILSNMMTLGVFFESNYNLPSKTIRKDIADESLYLILGLILYLEKYSPKFFI